MKKKIDLDLILDYLENHCSDRDRKKVLDWTNESEENKKELEILTKIWNTPDFDFPEPDVEKALQSVKHRIDNYPRITKAQQTRILKISSLRKDRTRIKYSFNNYYLKAAAILVGLIIGTYFIFYSLKDEQLHEVLVKNKTQKNITLSDGTMVKLDAGSLLRYPENFESDYREIYLDGEGYFDVTANPQAPFTVHTRDGKITVLGTQFNVRAWENNQRIIVTVVKGKVSLQSDISKNEKDKVMISGGQMSMLDKNGILSNPTEVDVDNYLSWFNREIHLQSVPLAEVLDQIERWYDVEFTLPDESYNEKIVTVFIENKPLDAILNVISLIMNLNYELNGNKVIFSKRNDNR